MPSFMHTNYTTNIDILSGSCFSITSTKDNVFLLSYTVTDDNGKYTIISRWAESIQRDG